MTGFTVEFEFEIGEMLWIKGSYEQRGIVTDRIAQQCSGGIQLMYKLSRFGDFIPEIALTREPPGPVVSWRADRIPNEQTGASNATND